jgi:hypothetical protein
VVVENTQPGPVAEERPAKKVRSQRQREVFQRCQEARKRQVEAIRARKTAVKAERQAQRRRRKAVQAIMETSSSESEGEQPPLREPEPLHTAAVELDVNALADRLVESMVARLRTLPAPAPSGGEHRLATTAIPNSAGARTRLDDKASIPVIILSFILEVEHQS